jgi:hypothetical protein
VCRGYRDAQKTHKRVCHDARATEQVLIEHYTLPTLLNKIYSIADTNPIYAHSPTRGAPALGSASA